MIDKRVPSAKEAVADIPDGASLAVGGFGVSGVPIVMIRALAERDISGLEVYSNNCGVDGGGLGLLLEQHKIHRVVASYIGNNGEFARQFLDGEIEVELTPQGSLAERLRAAGAGIPAFFTPAGVGTLVADGGLPLRYGHDGEPIRHSAPKQVQDFDVFGRSEGYVLETALPADFALVRAARADWHGNLVFSKAARNFNPLVAMAGRITIVEAEEVVPPGGIDGDAVHLPGIYVHRVVELDDQEAHDLPIEKLTVRRRGDQERTRGADA